MLKRSSRFLLPLAAGLCLLLFLSVAYLIHKEHETLNRLLHPGDALLDTEIYSRWLELKAREHPSRLRIVRWLNAVDYHRVAHAPTQAGDYQLDDRKATVFARPFLYPDKELPAQLMVLRFSSGHLDSLEASSGHADLKEWRLEPKSLARWSSGTKTARVIVRIAELPAYVPRAVLAIEDKRFFQHGAIDPMGILRALWVDMRHGQLRQGASTISQQLARSIFLNIHRTWHRKILEAVLASYLELRYSKTQLLEMYLNQVYWGHDGNDSLLGIESVSQSLFGKPARALTIAESATLAGMLQSPHRYSPRSDPAVAHDRRMMVLGLMEGQGVITKAQYQAARAEKLKLTPIVKRDEAAYFLAALRDQLSEKYSFPAFLNQGWRVFTTIDPLLQHEAVGALKPPVGQGGLLAMDPHDGAILAWVGGTNYQTNPFDHAQDAKRQPGSAFKPFVVLPALESRNVTTATFLEDKPLTLKGIKGSWTPQNYDRKFRGKASVWDSLVFSFNVPILRLAMKIGLPPIIDAARRAGIQSPLREDLSLALGTSEVSLLELTGAYNTLASGGVRRTPFNVRAIIGPDGSVLESHQDDQQYAFAPEVVYLVTQMLEDVLNVGTGRAARSMGLTVAAAGKTGTSENYQDAWFVGYTPNLVAGVWVGYDIPKSLGTSAAGIALPLWTGFMKKAVLLDPPAAFEEPKNLIWKIIDPETGLLVKTGCSQRLKVAFLQGTEPTLDCTLHSGGILGFIKRLTKKSSKQK